jgi:hypothetical protein
MVSASTSNIENTYKGEVKDDEPDAAWNREGARLFWMGFP